jgi:hypothetical protein
MDLWELKVHGGVEVCKAMMEDIFGVKIGIEILTKPGHGFRLPWKKLV